MIIIISVDFIISCIINQGCAPPIDNYRVRIGKGYN